MAENIIEPIEVLNEKGRAGVLFVLPWVRNVNDTCIDASQATQQFFKITSKVLPSWAAITLKKTSGQWGDEGLVERVQKGRARIDKAIKHYKPGIVVIMGVNFSKMLIPELRRSKQNLVSTFSTYTTLDGKEVPALVWGAPDKLIEDPLEHVRIPETLAKLYFFATRKHYEAKPVITNLDTYKASKEYIDFLTHEHDGYIGFDTETYNLNRIHHTRLGSMQFCTDAYNSYVMLWDSKHQAMSARDLDRLRDPIKNLFGSRTTKFNAWIAHNGAFDIMQIKAEFKTRTYKPVLDTMLLTHLMDENRKFTARVSLPKAGPQALKTLVQEFMGFTHYSDEAMKARSDGTLMDLPLPDFLEYSGFDPIVTYRLFHVLKAWAKLEKYDKAVLNLLRNLHSRALKMYSDISENGFPIDKESVISLLDKSSIINKRIAEINEEYKAIPEVQKVNRELAEQKAESTMFLRVPYVFDINKQAHRSALFFHSKHGFQFPANEEGKYSAGKKFQKENAKNPCVALFAEAQGLVKLRDAYIKPIFESVFGPNAENTDVCDGRVHSDFMLSRTVTGRVASRNPNCIAAGTYIEVVRDLSKKPKGVKIEDVRVGDLVYCYDKNLKLTLRPVTDVIDNGKKPCIRIHWEADSHKKKHTGYVDLTSDHRVRLTSGKYKPAGELVENDRVMALSRGMSSDYSNLLATGHKSVPDHTFIWSTLNKNSKLKNSREYHIHHKDGSKLNNNVDNLELLSTEQHLKAHALLNAEYGKVHFKGKGEFTAKRLYNSKFALLRFIYACGGVIKNCRAMHVDFYSVKEALSKHRVNWSALAFRFGADGSYISRARILKLSHLPSEQSSSDLKIGTRRLKDLCVFYKIPYGSMSKKSYVNTTKQVKDNVNQHRVQHNHRITKIEMISGKKRVYDLTVAWCHNFIANEICVHNCQQVPRSDSPVKKAIKSLFVPGQGKILIQADLSAAEVRVWGALSGDEQICRLSREAMVLRKQVRDNPNDLKMRKEAELKADFHKQTYGLCYNKPPSEVTKPERQDAKKLSFGLLYGMSLNGLCRELGKEQDVVQEIMDRFFGVYQTGSQWLTKMQDFAVEHGYVQTPLGRRRRIPQVFTGDRAAISEAKRFAVNAPIQATASDYAMLSTCLLQDAIVEAEAEDDVKLLNCVHDSVVLEVTATPEWIAWVIKTVRRAFTKDVVKVLKRDFDFELLAPIDIDFEISQHVTYECKKCKAKRHPGESDDCENPIKTGKKKEDGSDETYPCGCKEYIVHEHQPGWGRLMALEENAQGIAKAMKGIKATFPKVKKQKYAKA